MVRCLEEMPGPNPSRVIVGDCPRCRQAVSAVTVIASAQPSPAQCGKGGTLDGKGKGSRCGERRGDPGPLDGRGRRHAAASVSLEGTPRAAYLGGTQDQRLTYNVR